MPGHSFVLDGKRGVTVKPRGRIGEGFIFLQARRLRLLQRRLRLTAGMPRLAFGSRPSGKHLSVLPAARETLGGAWILRMS